MTEAEYIQCVINSGLTIVIVSGEGAEGRIKEYKGPHTVRAILSRLKKERRNGDRWARVDVRESVIVDDSVWAMYRHGCI